MCTIAAELNERDNAREQPRKSLRYPVIQEWAWGSTTLPLTRLRIVRALKAVFVARRRHTTAAFSAPCEGLPRLRASLATRLVSSPTL